ncbi:beta-hydroxyacyl-ACP dehydratase [Patiriisocius marinus]|uniref:Beta-hydroxyacyl-ACP dehydratase n=1 Tax=Patiriisocius marinus TaxID=1397112 RepID=A0A5J4J4P7_9FLAO|nr:beta-hydroxyacyl-ACP dehydratase [Patiriisocius marinus]
MQITLEEIRSKLPYTKPFLFVDGLTRVDENGVEGFYTFNKNAEFYKGHFKDNPITPGVLLTECMAQIGVVCLGIFLLGNATDQTKIALSNQHIDFLKAVMPGEKVQVVSEKVYFRFGKLKCKVRMLNEANETVALGEISGMIV